MRSPACSRQQVVFSCLQQAGERNISSSYSPNLAGAFLPSPVEEILLIFYYSRKGGLLINNIVGILGAAAMGFAKFAEFYELLIMGRFLIGVNCGE